MQRQVSFEEFWELKSKGQHHRRLREVTITVIRAENILNAGSTLLPPPPGARLPVFTAADPSTQQHIRSSTIGRWSQHHIWALQAVPPLPRPRNRAGRDSSPAWDARRERLTPVLGQTGW